MRSPASLIVTTGAATMDQELLVQEAFRTQRERLGRTLRGLSGDDWNTPSRCAEWTVHEVARHLCDTTLKATALLQGAHPSDVDAENMDPRTDPLNWLSRSASEDPSTTVQTLEASTAALEAEVKIRRERGAADVEWVYGPAPWSVALLHVFWDAWVHERDMLLPLGIEHTTSAIEDRAAAVYGLVMAALPNLAMGSSLDESVALAGSGGGIFHVQASNDSSTRRQLTMVGLPAEGTVTVAVQDEVDCQSDPLRGDLRTVVDSLVGRAPDLAEALAGPTDRVQALGIFGAFMHLPT